MWPASVYTLLAALLPTAVAQFSAMDRTQQELTLMDWSAGFRIAYCQQASIAELIEPFRDAMVKMTNRYCKNATACRIEKPVEFTRYNIVLLDGFPKREGRAVSFRFYIVLPFDAKPLNKKMEKPYLWIKVLTEILRTQAGAELTNRLGWQIINRDRYPRFDQTTVFMNWSLIPLGVIAGLFMLFLAYWSGTIISGSSIYSGEGWSVSGSRGGKNAALRRTMEIIEEQKFRFDHVEKNQPDGQNLYVYQAVPRPGVRIPRESRELTLTAAQLPVVDAGGGGGGLDVTSGGGGGGTSRQSSVEATAAAGGDDEAFGSEERDRVPEIVVMSARDSRDAHDSGGESRRTSAASHRRQSRRFSALDAVRGKSRGGLFGTRSSQPERAKRWKTGNIMLNQFGSKDGHH